MGRVVRSSSAVRWCRCEGAPRTWRVTRPGVRAALGSWSTGGHHFWATGGEARAGGPRRGGDGRAASVDGSDVIVVGDRVDTALPSAVGGVSRKRAGRRRHLRGHSGLGGLPRRWHLRVGRERPTRSALDCGAGGTRDRRARSARQARGPVGPGVSCGRSRSCSVPSWSGARPVWCRL